MEPDASAGSLLGRVKTMGQFGPRYVVAKMIPAEADSERQVEIILVESGERSTYRLDSAESDPLAD